MRKFTNISEELKKNGGDWDYLLSVYNNEEVQYKEKIIKLKTSLDTITQESIKTSLLEEITKEEEKLKKVADQKKELQEYLVRFQDFIKKIKVGVEEKKKNNELKSEEYNKQIEVLIGEKKQLEKALETMKEFPNVVEATKREIKKVDDAIGEINKNRESLNKGTSSREKILEKIQKEGREAIEGIDPLFQSKFTIEKGHEGQCFFNDAKTGQRITDISKLGIIKKKHGAFTAKQINNKIIWIVSYDDTFIVDIEKGVVVGKSYGALTTCTYGNSKYAIVKDKDAHYADYAYNVIDLSTGKKINTTELLGDGRGTITEINNTPYIVMGNRQSERVLIYKFPSGEQVGEKEGYIGTNIIDTKKLADSNTKDKIEILGKEKYVYITSSNGLTIVDKNTFEQICEIPGLSKVTKLNDGSILTLVADKDCPKDCGILFNIEERKMVRSDYLKLGSVKDNSNFMEYKKVDGNDIIVNKQTKEATDIMGRVNETFSPETGDIIVVGHNKNGEKTKQSLFDVKTGKKMGAVCGTMIYYIVDLEQYYKKNIMIIKNDNNEYARIDILKDTDGKGNVVVKKRYKKIERDSYRKIVKLSNGLFSNLHLDERGNII